MSTCSNRNLIIRSLLKLQLNVRFAYSINLLTVRCLNKRCFLCSNKEHFTIKSTTFFSCILTLREKVSFFYSKHPLFYHLTVQAHLQFLFDHKFDKTKMRQRVKRGLRTKLLSKNLSHFFQRNFAT